MEIPERLMMGRNVLMSWNVYLLFQLWREGCADAKVEYSTDMNMSWEILTYIQWRKTPPSINKKRPANPFFTRLGLESRDLGFPRVHRAHTRVALLTRSSGRLAFFRFFLLLNPDDRSPYWLWRWTARKCVGRSFFFSQREFIRLVRSARLATRQPRPKLWSKI